MKTTLLFSICLLSICIQAQQLLTPEKLWELKRLSANSLSADGSTVYFSVTTPIVAENKSSTEKFSLSLLGGKPEKIAVFPNEPAVTMDNEADAIRLFPNGQKVVFSREVKVKPISGQDKYPTLTKSNALIYDDLNNRHWDTWEDGKYSHLFIADVVAGYAINEKDLMPNAAFDCPQKPHGGDEDFIVSPDNKHIIYVCKKSEGKVYAQSTNTDIFDYNVVTGATTNLSEGMKGYDTHPLYNKEGTKLAWLSMKTDGNESDKNDIVVYDIAKRTYKNLTKKWDETVEDFKWSNDGNMIYFNAPRYGTEQLFSVEVLKNYSPDENEMEVTPKVKQITNGQFNINGLVGQSAANTYVVSRCDMNHATELYTVDLTTGNMKELTQVNDVAYSNIKMCKVLPRTTVTEEGIKVFSWVIYPPNFDCTKKYPVLLYCQGGPQSALSQFYSFRWNFQLMASNGYIVIAPNRTGMPGWGVEHNAAISKGWGGAPMRDYLAVIDDISNEQYIDTTRRGAVGASYGGYSVFMLAGIHEGRFKTFIAHDGLFDLKSWYGTTEELWFANNDIGGNYWDLKNKAANKSYIEFSPSNYIDKWNTPIMIYQGGKDFRVGIEQGLQAFQAAQLRGIKSRLVYMPDENHWVLKAQTAMVWQQEFYKWLKETL
jgi:dipeptidyl aminopeptidase/acylaminoacyl peptidase